MWMWKHSPMHSPMSQVLNLTSYFLLTPCADQVQQYSLEDQGLHKGRCNSVTFRIGSVTLHTIVLGAQGKQGI